MAYIQRKGNYTSSLVDGATKQLWTYFKTITAKEMNLRIIGVWVTFTPI